MPSKTRDLREMSISSDAAASSTGGGDGAGRGCCGAGAGSGAGGGGEQRSRSTAVPCAGTSAVKELWNTPSSRLFQRSRTLAF